MGNDLTLLKYVLWGMIAASFAALLIPSTPKYARVLRVAEFTLGAFALLLLMLLVILPAAQVNTH